SSCVQPVFITMIMLNAPLHLLLRERGCWDSATSATCNFSRRGKTKDTSTQRTGNSNFRFASMHRHLCVFREKSAQKGRGSDTILFPVRQPYRFLHIRTMRTILFDLGKRKFMAENDTA